MNIEELIENMDSSKGLELQADQSEDVVVTSDSATVEHARKMLRKRKQADADIEFITPVHARQLFKQNETEGTSPTREHQCYKFLRSQSVSNASNATNSSVEKLLASISNSISKNSINNEPGVAQSSIVSPVIAEQTEQTGSSDEIMIQHDTQTQSEDDCIWLKAFHEVVDNPQLNTAEKVKRVKKLKLQATEHMKLLDTASEIINSKRNEALHELFHLKSYNNSL